MGADCKGPIEFPPAQAELGRGTQVCLVEFWAMKAFIFRPVLEVAGLFAMVSLPMVAQAPAPPADPVGGSK